MKGRNESSLKEKVIRYIENCRLEDGGYFFARVPPSSRLDTYFAVKSLALLKTVPESPAHTAAFFLDDFKEGTLTGMTAIFTGVEVLHELGQITEEVKDYALRHVISYQNSAGGYGALQDFDVELTSELQDTYRAVKVLTDIKAGIDKPQISGFLRGYLNADGGYGRNGYSTLASTFYATAVHRMLGTDTKTMQSTRDYLRQRERRWQVEFIEDIYWLTMGLVNTGERVELTDKIRHFVTECQRPNGGFARAVEIGIPTLEYTFYAVSVLNCLDML